MEDIFNRLIEPYKTYETWQIYLEAFATILGIASVYFSMIRNILVYPTGIISTFIYIFLLFNWGLYGETLINVYYTVMSIYGWLLWRNHTIDDSLEVEVLRMNKKEYFIGFWLFLFSFLFVLSIYYFKPYIQSGFQHEALSEIGFNYTKVDYIDALVTSIFLIGMWLMARRKIENWYCWIIGDFVAVFLYFYKGYAITGFQYIVFTILAVTAYFLWLKQIRKSEEKVNNV